MKHFISKLLIAAVLVSSVGFVATARAEEQAVQSTAEVEASTLMQSKTERAAEAKKKAAEAREEARKKLAEQKTQVEEKTKEQRSKACEARKESITKRLEDIAAFGERHRGTFDAILGRVDEFVEKRNLNVENQAELKVAVENAKVMVDENIAALDELKGNVDCSDPESVAASLEAFKMASTELRQTLKDYREAIRTYMQAVKKAAEVQTDTESAETETNSTEGVQ